MTLIPARWTHGGGTAVTRPLSHVVDVRPQRQQTMRDDLYVVVILGYGRWPILAPDCDPCERHEADALARELTADGLGPVVVCHLTAVTS